MKYLYKTVAALGALSVLPLIVFLQDIYFKISSAALSAVLYIGQLLDNQAFTDLMQENGGKTPSAIAAHYSLYDLYNFALELDLPTGSGDLIEKIEPLITPAITSAVALILVAICAIVTAVLAFVVKDNRKVIYSSIVGIGLCFVFKECFEGLAAPILEGTVSIATLMESVWGGLIGKFEVLTLNTNFWFLPMVFGAVILWTVLYNYTLPEKEKKERKRMLGEAEEE